MKDDFKIKACRISKPNNSYIAIAMYTKKYEKLAERLANSLLRYNLDHCLFEVPTVHKSISPNGSENLNFCKPNFILHARKIFDKPILYLDCDTVIRQNPVLIESLSQVNADFAILNWLACEDNSAYVPLTTQASSELYWGYSHSIDLFSTSQLICSGAVQYWGGESASDRLLNDWFAVISENPESQDDHCLDFSFNNLPNEVKIKYQWLPKAYSRYAWWIFDNPIIDHPQIPYSGNFFKEISANNGKSRCYPNALKENINDKKVLNTETGELYKIQGDILIKIGMSENFWISTDEI